MNGLLKYNDVTTEKRSGPCFGSAIGDNKIVCWSEKSTKAKVTECNFSIWAGWYLQGWNKYRDNGKVHTSFP